MYGIIMSIHVQDKNAARRNELHEFNKKKKKKKKRFKTAINNSHQCAHYTKLRMQIIVNSSRTVREIKSKQINEIASNCASDNSQYSTCRYY